MGKTVLFRKISVTDEIYMRLKADKAMFAKDIGGRWSLSRVIEEYLKILSPNYEPKNRRKYGRRKK